MLFKKINSVLNKSPAAPLAYNAKTYVHFLWKHFRQAILNYHKQQSIRVAQNYSPPLLTVTNAVYFRTYSEIT